MATRDKVQAMAEGHRIQDGGARVVDKVVFDRSSRAVRHRTNARSLPSNIDVAHDTDRGLQAMCNRVTDEIT